VPDTVSLIIWLIGGIAGGFAVGDLLRRGHPARNLIWGAVGGVIGSQILQLLIPALRGFSLVPILSQLIVPAASGAALTIVGGAVMRSAAASIKAVSQVHDELGEQLEPRAAGSGGARPSAQSHQAR
jgi:hypothetical protein